MRKFSFAFAFFAVVIGYGNVAVAATARLPRGMVAVNATMYEAAIKSAETLTKVAAKANVARLLAGEVVAVSATALAVTTTTTGVSKKSWLGVARWIAIGDKCNDVVVLGARYSGNNSLQIQKPALGFESSNPKFNQSEVFLDTNLSERWTLEASMVLDSVMGQKISFFGSYLGEVGINLQPTAALKCYPLGNGTFRPYVGYGVTYVKLNGAYQVGGESFTTSGEGWKGVLRAGLDVNVPGEWLGKWSVFIDYRYEPFKMVTNMDDVGAPPVVSKFGDQAVLYGIGLRL